MKNAGLAYPGKVQLHTRQSVLTRLVMHDAFTAATLRSSTGMHGLASMDPWAPLGWPARM